MVTIHIDTQKTHNTLSKTTERPNIPKLPLDKVHNLKDQIKEGNLRLYKMQAEVLATTNQQIQPGSKDIIRIEELQRRSWELEEHISGLCIELKTARAMANGNDGFQTWRKAQEKTVSSIEKSLSKSLQGNNEKLTSALKTEASTLEAEAELMVMQLRAKLNRGDFSEFKTAQRIHQTELASLELELTEAKKKGLSVENILLRIKACGNDMTRTTEASSDSDESSDESEDEDLTYESAAPHAVGDRVMLVCDDEDGFKRGDTGTIVEVDPTIAYPYRVKSRSGDGFFKACDIKLVERKVVRTSCPLSPKPVTKLPAEPVPAFSDTPYSSRSSSPYKSNDEQVEDDLDLEKGRCARKNSVGVSFFAKAKELTVTLNPLV